MGLLGLLQCLKRSQGRETCPLRDWKHVFEPDESLRFLWFV